MYNPLDFHSRLILVTGASSGIGRETAILLSRLNARLILTGRNIPRLEDTLSQLEGTGHRVAPLDLCQLDEIPKWLRNVASEESLAGLVHSAGMHATAPLAMLTVKRIEDVLRLNAMASITLARAFCQKGCFDAGGSSIVFVSSIASFSGSPGLSLYGSSKAMLGGLTKNLAIELAIEKIRVNCVLAGLVQTEMTERFKRRLTAEQFQAILDKHPLGSGLPSDVANTVAFLLSSAARWITGAEFVVDGGYTAA